MQFKNLLGMEEGGKGFFVTRDSDAKISCVTCVAA